MSRIATLLAAMLILSAATFAQSDGYVATSNTRGLAPENTFMVGDIDTVNLANGALNLHIPLYSRKGRGMSVAGYLNYSSKFWIQLPDWDQINGALDFVYWTESPYQGSIQGFSLQVSGGGLLTENQQTYDCSFVSEGTQYNYTETVDSAFIYRAEDGSSYRFPNVHVDLNPNYANRECYSIGAVNQGNSDNGEMSLNTTQHPFILYHKDGTQECVDVDYWLNPCPSVFLTDTNGNRITFGANNTILDTVGRSFNRFTSPSVVDSNGNTQNYTISTQGTFSGTTQFPSTTEGNGVPVEQGNSVFVGTQTLTLPDGRTYVFSFDPTFGEVTKVTLPTGGYMRYQYTTLAAADTIPSFSDGTCCLFKIDSRRVSARFVSSTGLSQDEKEWQYSYSGNTTTLTDPLGNVSTHTFSTADPFNPAYETQAQYYQGSATLLKTVATVWEYDGGIVLRNLKVKVLGDTNWRISSQTTTLNDTNQVKQETYTYDPYSATMLTKSEYDWGSGASGPLIRRTVYTYLYDSNSNYAAKNILDRITSKTIYDSTGNTCQGLSQACAQTTYGYDTTTIATQSGVVQHDYTDYPSSMIYRGNLTTASTWRNTDNSWLTTTNYYDELGNLLQTTDPLSHSTNFAYADSWSGTSCVPSGGTANAFATKTTNALTQFATAKYFPCSSLAASTTDLNSLTTSFAYDGLDRLTQVTYPDGGLKTDCYSDISTNSCYSSSVPPYVVTTIKMNISQNQNLIGTTLVDGLGRVAETQVNSDPQGTVYTDITYDALGRQYTVSNPYRSTSDQTYGLTTDFYDALSRPTITVAPDGTIPTGSTCPSNDVCTSYSGNTTTVTDQAGISRKSVTDGAGRLSEMIENPGGLAYQTNYTYDTLDDLTSVAQNSSRQRTFVYNSLAQLTSSTNPESNTTSSGTTVATTYSYDSDGNVMQKTMPAQNQQSTATVTLTYCYDALNRTTAKGYTVQTCTNGVMPTPVATYWYDGTTPTSPSNCSTGVSNYGLAIGRRTAMCDTGGTGVESWTYSDVQNTGWQTVQKRTTNSITMSTTTQNNLIGFPATVTYPSGRTITYTYDSAVRASEAQDLTNNINYALGSCANGISNNGVCYAPQGAIWQIKNGTNVVATYLYDKRLQPCWIYATTGTALATNTLCTATDSNPANILDLKYNFNLGTTDNGNVWGITNNRDTTRSQNFTYDSLNRLLTGETTSTYSTSPAHCWGEGYQYDGLTSGGAYGNLTSIIVASTSYNGCTQESLSATASAQNRLSSNGYDTAGNATSYGSWTYTYNAENQMTQAATSSTTNYVYDGDGRRVEKSVSGTVTKIYWYNGDDVLDETDGTGSFTNSSFNEYIFFGGNRIARRDSSSNIFYYFADHLGTSREIVQAGQTSPCYESDFYPFGGERPPIVDNCPQNNYKFTGKERDSESGLDNFGARYDSSSIGRFMSPDWSAAPEGVPYANLDDPQSLNLYAYTRNNPVTLTDPDGHCWGWIQWLCNTGQRFYYAFTDFGFVTHAQVDAIKRQYLIDQRAEINGEQRDYTKATNKQVEEDYDKVMDAIHNHTANQFPLTPGEGGALYRDSTGRIHGKIPDYPDPNMSKAQLEEQASELRESIKQRKAEQQQFGDDADAGHADRIRQEERYLRQIQNRLGGANE